MKIDIRFFICLLLMMSIAGCTSQEKKKSEETVVAPAKPQNFERIFPPVMMTDPQERAGYMLEHFWDKFNFRDTMYCHTPEITEQAFVDFLALCPYVSSAKVSSAVKKMLDSAMVDVVMYNYFYKKGEHYLYEPNSPMRNDEYFIPFLEHVVSVARVVEADKVRPRYQLNLANKNRIGVKAQNFTYTLNSGATGNLYGISAKYVLLMFFNPDCTECRNTTAQLRSSSAVTAAVSAGTLKVLAVYPDENLEIWKKHINEIPASWINSYDKALSIRKDEIYDLKAIPTLYLLDKDKMVILKDTSTGSIHEYLEKNP